MAADPTWSDAARTLSVGAAGAALFWTLGLPMPFLTGPAAAVSIVALTGLSLGIPPLLRDVCFLLLGLNIGASVTPEVIETAADWPISLALLAGLLVLSLRLCTLLLHRGFGFDRTSAFLAATPGHLSFVMSLSAERNLPIDRIAVVQSVRVLLLTIALPFGLVAAGFDAGLSVTESYTLSLFHLAILLVLSFALGRIFAWFKVPAALLLGAMAVSGIGHGTGLTPGAPEPALAYAAFAVMGCLIGTRFAGLSVADLRRSALAGVAATALASGLMLAGALGLAAMAGLDPLLLFVAYAPGGVEAMAAISVQLNLAAAVVAAHHVMRLLVLSVLVPLMMPKDRAAR